MDTIRQAQSGNTETLDASNARLMEDVLTFFTLCDDEQRPVKTQDFDGAFLLGDSGGYKDPTMWIEGRQLEHKALIQSITDWRIRLASADPVKNPKWPLALIRIRPMPELVRLGIVASNPDLRLVPPHQALYGEVLGVHASGRTSYDRGGYVFIRRGHYCCPRGHDLANFESTCTFLDHAAAMIWSSRRRWQVQFRIAPAAPALTFMTDIVGVREFLRFREAEDGAARRAAIIHWVSRHWRQNRHDPEMEIYVRKHLRGKQSVQWHGMTVKIIAPPEAINEVESEKALRRRLSSLELTQRRRAALRSR